tara:strand:- start:643 stop:1491 length:849 start_codon:yes stop_codon:yes gene_type:complete
MTPRFDQLVNEKILNIAGSAGKAEQRVYDEVKAAAERVEKAGTSELTSAEQRKIQALEDIIAKGGEGMSTIDKVQIALDVGGVASLYTNPTPVGVGAFVVGTASDATNATISIARGIGSAMTGDTDNVKRHFAAMSLSLLGLIPWIGDAAKAAKLSAKGIKHAKGASTLQKAIKTTKTGAAAGSKRLGRAIKSGGAIVHKGKDVGKLAPVLKKAGDLDRGVKLTRAAIVGKAGVGALKGGRAKLKDVEEEDPANVIPMKQANATHQNVKRPPVSLAASWKRR